MIKFFRKIRQRLLTENKFSKYLIYAFGEILLVMIGILLALQVNNWNEEKKERAVEINYLQNIKSDLLKEIGNNELYEGFRLEKSKNCFILLNTSLPKTIEDAKEYTDKYEQVFFVKAYVPYNNTFKELLSSGNLSLIKNDSIKNALLDLDKMYADISIIEHHMKREFEEYLYNPSIKNISALGFYDISKPTNGLTNRLQIKDIPKLQHNKLIVDAQWLHNSQIFNNGLKLAMMNNNYIADIHKNLAEFFHKLLKYIDEEIKK
jgi:hypothetical protein